MCTAEARGYNKTTDTIVNSSGREASDPWGGGAQAHPSTSQQREEGGHEPDGPSTVTQKVPGIQMPPNEDKMAAKQI